MSKLRKEKVKKYQKIKRLKLTSEQKNQIRFAKWEDQRMRRKDEKVENSEKWTDIFRHNNLKELKESGSYFYFLHDFQPRTTFFGRSLPTITETDGDWKWLDNKIFDVTTMGQDFFHLSQQFALLFQHHGIGWFDVIHVITRNFNSALIVLGASWIIGAICSLSDISVDVEAIKHQVS